MLDILIKIHNYLGSLLQRQKEKDEQARCVDTLREFASPGSQSYWPVGHEFYSFCADDIQTLIREQLDAIRVQGNLTAPRFDTMLLNRSGVQGIPSNMFSVMPKSRNYWNATRTGWCAEIEAMARRARVALAKPSRNYETYPVMVGEYDITVLGMDSSGELFTQVLMVGYASGCGAGSYIIPQYMLDTWRLKVSP